MGAERFADKIKELEEQAGWRGRLLDDSKECFSQAVCGVASDLMSNMDEICRDGHERLNNRVETVNRISRNADELARLSDDENRVLAMGPKHLEQNDLYRRGTPEIRTRIEARAIPETEWPSLQFPEMAQGDWPAHGESGGQDLDDRELASTGHRRRQRQALEITPEVAALAAELGENEQGLAKLMARTPSASAPVIREAFDMTRRYDGIYAEDVLAAMNAVLRIDNSPFQLNDLTAEVPTPAVNVEGGSASTAVIAGTTSRPQPSTAQRNEAYNAAIVCIDDLLEIVSDYSLQLKLPDMIALYRIVGSAQGIKEVVEAEISAFGHTLEEEDSRGHKKRVGPTAHRLAALWVCGEKYPGGIVDLAFDLAAENAQAQEMFQHEYYLLDGALVDECEKLKPVRKTK